MDIQKHSRTEQIKKLSRKLFTFLTLFKYLLYMCWPLMIFIAFFFDKGTLKLGDVVFNIEEMVIWFKELVLLLYAIALYMAIRLTNSFRQIMKHFMAGHIFTKKAVLSVRSGLHAGLMFFIMIIVQKASGLALAMINNMPSYIELEIDFFIAISFFGLMYILLWALEIGCDLNEESEMTI